MPRPTFTPVPERFARKIVGKAVKNTRLSCGQAETVVRRTIRIESSGSPAEQVPANDARAEAIIRQLVAQFRPRNTPASAFSSAPASVN